MHAAAPLYSEAFDADAALATSLKTVYFAESHSKVYTSDLLMNITNASR
jgi:proline iminopeptidase